MLFFLVLLGYLPKLKHGTPTNCDNPPSQSETSQDDFDGKPQQCVLAQNNHIEAWVNSPTVLKQRTLTRSQQTCLSWVKGNLHLCFTDPNC